MEAGLDKKLVIGFLKEILFFKRLSEAHLNELTNNFTLRRFKKNETIFNQSDSSTDLYMVLDGKVKAVLLNEDGEELMLATFGNGDFFGEMSLFNGKPRSATIMAIEDSLLGILKRELFIQTIKAEPAIAIDLLSALARRLRMTDEMLESLAFLDVGQRLIKLFLQIAKKSGERDEKGWIKIRKLTHRDLASRIGASREAVTKALKVLAFKKAVVGKGNHFLISHAQKGCEFSLED